MFVYHGVVDQVTSSSVEFVVAILPSRVEVGSPCIVLCLPGVHGPQGDTENRDAQAPSSVHSFEAVIETMNIATGGKMATFTSGHHNVSMQLPRDMAMMHLSFLDDRDGSAISSSMGLIIQQPLFAAKAKDYLQTIFLGPVHLENQFQGYLVAVVLSENDAELANPANACIAWNAKTASTTRVVPRTVIEELEVEEQSEDVGSGQPHFAVNSQSHEFQGKIGPRESGNQALELSLRPHHDHGLPSSKDWSVVTIPQLDKHQETLLKMVSDFGIWHTIVINNDSNDVVTCTIEPTNAEWFGLGISSAGVVLAALGLPTVAPPLVGVWVAWSGLLLAVGSLADTLSTGDGSRSMVLYPNDKMEMATAGWFTYYGIIMVQNSVQSNGYKLVGTSYQVPSATLTSYQVRNIPLTPGVQKRTLFGIDLGKRSELSHRRLLGIRGVKPDTSLDLYGNPGTPNEGDILSYDSNGIIVGSWTDYFDNAGDYFFRAKWANWDTQIAIVQDSRDVFGRSKNVSICHLLQDPYSPVLCIQDAEIQSENYSPFNRIPIGTARTTDDVLKLIQQNMQSGYNWAYCHERSSSPFTVYAWRWTSSNAVKRNGGRNTYFVVGAESWTHMTMLK
ncbi:hypothetical protein FPHYL_3784 [Fusarium phyllophilum]|uniref:Uncharacterized protein n=1 Tax=Fusarium phyllophilum TaxID=47803 RepID=A0A8H5NI97_9HYPO|nr:hypothetical protein FPHYL_3784 [Fusarium phyllophilum]